MLAPAVVLFETSSPLSSFDQASCFEAQKLPRALRRSTLQVCARSATSFCGSECRPQSLYPFSSSIPVAVSRIGCIRRRLCFEGQRSAANEQQKSFLIYHTLRANLSRARNKDSEAVYALFSRDVITSCRLEPMRFPTMSKCGRSWPGLASCWPLWRVLSSICQSFTETPKTRHSRDASRFSRSRLACVASSSLRSSNSFGASETKGDTGNQRWSTVFSRDSRNCGHLVRPAIAWIERMCLLVGVSRAGFYRGTKTKNLASYITQIAEHKAD